jgi:hypothetical protein
MNRRYIIFSTETQQLHTGIQLNLLIIHSNALGAVILSMSFISSPTLSKDLICLTAPGAGHTLAAKEHIHILKRNTFCLGNKEEGKAKSENNRAREKKECAVFDVGHHVRSRVDNDELAEPLSTGGKDEADGADGHGEDLSAKKDMLVLVLKLPFYEY